MLNQKDGGMKVDHMAACSGCQHGACKTRQACMLPSDPDDDVGHTAKAFFLAAIWLVVAALAFGLAMSI